MAPPRGGRRGRASRNPGPQAGEPLDALCLTAALAPSSQGVSSALDGGPEVQSPSRRTIHRTGTWRQGVRRLEDRWPDTTVPSAAAVIRPTSTTAATRCWREGPARRRALQLARRSGCRLGSAHELAAAVREAEQALERFDAAIPRLHDHVRLSRSRRRPGESQRHGTYGPLEVREPCRARSGDGRKMSAHNNDGNAMQRSASCAKPCHVTYGGRARAEHGRRSRRSAYDAARSRATAGGAFGTYYAIATAPGGLQGEEGRAPTRRIKRRHTRLA